MTGHQNKCLLLSTLLWSTCAVRNAAFTSPKRTTTFGSLRKSDAFRNPRPSPSVAFARLNDDDDVIDTTATDDSIPIMDDYDNAPVGEKSQGNLIGLDFLPGVASLLTPNSPAGYLLPLTSTSETSRYAMIDVPPFSETLLSQIRSFLAANDGGDVAAIVITNKNSIHYDTSSSSVHARRRSDLTSWVEAFEGVEVVMHRIDVPRDMSGLITQVLDGYGPWALEDGRFVETGVPMKVLEWDDDKIQEFMKEGEVHEKVEDRESLDAAVREKEEGKGAIVVYTPGHTMGSVCVVLPNIRACCSGFTIPEDMVGTNTAPRLDYRGFISTNRAGIKRQCESARNLAQQYADRFTYVLPSRGEVITVDSQQSLTEIIDFFEDVGGAYDSLGGNGAD